jgi:hypothetical protein
MPGSKSEIRGDSVLVWAAIISWSSVGPLITLHGQITAREYMGRWGNQVHPMIQMLFLNNDAVFQDSAPIHAAGTVLSQFEEHEGELQHLSWPAQLPNLNIATLWSVWRLRVRSRFPSPTSLKQLEDVLREECYKIPLQTLQNLYKSIPRRTAVVLKAKGGPTPY